MKLKLICTAFLISLANICCATTANNTCQLLTYNYFYDNSSNPNVTLIISAQPDTDKISGTLIYNSISAPITGHCDLDYLTFSWNQDNFSGRMGGILSNTSIHHLYVLRNVGGFINGKVVDLGTLSTKVMGSGGR